MAQFWYEEGEGRKNAGIHHPLMQPVPLLEYAQQLHLSPKTVRNYTSNIFAKLQVADRAEAILRARDAGMG